MTKLTNERVCYFNGDYVPESQALVPYRDRSFLFGDGTFDMTRTFGHRIFKIDEHIERLYRSMRALRIGIDLDQKQMIEISRTVLEKNLHLLDDKDDYWVGQRISRGVMKVDGDNWDNYGPAIIVECTPLPLDERAHYYRDGIPVIVPSVRRTPPDALTPRAKSHNYLNLVMGDLEARAHRPDGWAIVLDQNGNLCEGLGSNIFLVREGELLTPRAQFVLPGVSRQTVIDLAAQLGIPCRETDLDLYDAYNAEEAFVTSTSFCIAPIASINGVTIGDGPVYGPLTQQLIDAYVELVDCNFVEQYLSRLNGSGT